MKTNVHIKSYTRMFITALFIIAKKWKQPKCPSTYEWYICTIENDVYIKSNEILIHATTQMKHALTHAKLKKSVTKPHIVWFHLYETSRMANP